MPSSSGALVIIIKPKPKYRIYALPSHCCFTFCTEVTLTRVMHFWMCITRHNFRTSH